MIPAQMVTEWSTEHPWQTREQVEQDLLLSQAICTVAQHPLLGAELVFRGGTAFHKLHLSKPERYSEDLDYVRTTSGGIGQITGALLDMGKELEFDVASRMGEHPKVLWRTSSDAGTPIRIKIEINTHELSPAQSLITLRHAVTSSWWSGTADVLTFTPEELVSTKLRALFQRSKGRDLFDLWLALTHLHLDPARILSSFTPYRPDRYTATRAIANLREKLTTGRFRTDLAPLLAGGLAGYDPDVAAELVITELLEKIE